MARSRQIRTGPNSPKRTQYKKSSGRSMKAKSFSGSKKQVKDRSSLVGRHTSQWWEHEAKKGRVLYCTSCDSVFYDGHWHTLSVVAIKHAMDSRAKKVICPTCGLQKKGGEMNWEGELILKNVKKDDEEEILRIVRNFAKRAQSRNPESRILSINTKGARIRILTTRNDLAVRMGKKLDEARKGGKLTIRFSDDDKPARVTWVAP